MKYKLEGVKDFKAGLRAYRKASGAAFQRASEMAADHIRDEAQQLVPVDTGALRASADYYSRGSGWGTVTIIGFGFKVTGFFDENGQAKVPREYAVEQHEYPYAHSDGRTFLYLELAISNNIDYISQIFAGELRRS